MNIEDKEMRELYNSLTPEQQKAAKELEKALSLSLTKLIGPPCMKKK